MPTAFWAGAQYGLTGLALAWLIAFPVVFVLNLRRMLPLLNLRVIHVMRAVAPAALAGVCMYGAVTFARGFATAHVQGPLLMVMLIAIGAATYLSLVWLTNRNVVREIADLLGIARIEGIAKRHQD